MRMVSTWGRTLPRGDRVIRVTLRERDRESAAAAHAATVARVAAAARQGGGQARRQIHIVTAPVSIWSLVEGQNEGLFALFAPLRSWPREPARCRRGAAAVNSRLTKKAVPPKVDDAPSIPRKRAVPFGPWRPREPLARAIRAELVVK